MLLQGLRVIEFAGYIAAPGAGCVLGDWGADVIKVERPGGDPMRNAFADLNTEPGANPIFELDNRGKRSIVLDVSTPGGVDCLKRLVSGADVFLTNTRLSALRKAGLDETALRAQNPRLVYALVTGYGMEGPDAHKPGFDVTAFWARAGVAAMTTPKGTDPFMIRTGVGDHTTSLATAAAILAALYERERTGVGRLVQTSLLATGVWTMGSDLAVQARFGRLASTRTRDNPANAIANLYRSADGRWFIHNPRGDKEDWQAFCAVAGRPELVSDERFSTGRMRRKNARDLTAELDNGFDRLDFAEIARRLDAADLAWAPLQTSADVVSDPQAAAAGAFLEIDNGAGGAFRSPAAPARFPGADAARRPSAPSLGEHTREVLTAAGYSPGEVETLFTAGAVA